MEDMELRRTWAEIDLDALAHNYRQARERIGSDVKYLGVVKADAYGHGAVQIAHALETLGADYLAVSSLDEARELRHGGVRAPVLILGHTPPAMAAELIRYGITQAVSGLAAAEAYSERAAESGGRLRVHMAVDTGMSRLGFRAQDGAEDIVHAARLPGLEAEGVFTHFAVSDEDGGDSEAYTRMQFERFTGLLAEAEAKGVRFALRHCANSGALARYPEMYLDMVRPGIALYGVGDDAERLGLRPVMALKTCISTVKTFPAGTDISYGRTYRTEGEARIGVLPIGYADGLPRCLSNRWQVAAEDGPAPIRGRICMDMCMIDLTGLSAGPGGAVTVFGPGNPIEAMAAAAGTIPYELLCAVSKRVPRVYLQGGRVVERTLRILE